MSGEPLAVRAVVVAVLTAIFSLLAAFGLPLTDSQESAVLALAAVVAPLLAAWWARGKVTPTGVQGVAGGHGVGGNGGAGPVPRLPGRVDDGHVRLSTADWVTLAALVGSLALIVAARM